MKMNEPHLVRPVGLSALRVPEVRLEASPVGHVVKCVRAEMPLPDHVRRVPCVVHELWEQLKQHKKRRNKGGGGVEQRTPSGLMMPSMGMLLYVDSVSGSAAPVGCWCAVGMRQQMEESCVCV